MQGDDFEREIKVLVVGNGNVGKSSMIKRLCKGEFTDEYKKTIGVDFLEKRQYVESLGEDAKLMVWDTAGQEEFDSITRTYYRGAGAAVLVFSTTDQASFHAVKRWKEKIEAESGPIPMALVQNKVDLMDQAEVSNQDAEALTRELRLRFYRTCVKDNLNVSEVFSYLAEQYLKNEGKSAGQGLPATATANLTTASSLPKAALPEMAAPVPPLNSNQIPKPQVVNFKKPKTSTSQRFLKCSVA
ncbi:Ras- protein Rab-23 [Trebouxia sp. C0009 RCD-2024]